jgi:GR25 family glycosyltransferase involved in LPS biosynthesis
MYTIHVINLDRDTEKMTEFARQVSLGDPKIEYVKFKACDASLPCDDVDYIGINPACESWLCNSKMIGCARSHMTLWTQLSRSGDDNNYKIIMEDDARFCPDAFCDAMDCICDLLSNDRPVIISFMCIGPFCRVGFGNVTRQSKSSGTKYVLTESIFPLAATAYAINKSAARYLLQKMQSTVHYHIDFSVAQHAATSSLTYYTIEPTVVTTSSTHFGTVYDTKSSIGSHHSASLFFGWNRNIMWLLNVPAWRFTSLYTLVLVLVLIVLVISWLVSRGGWHEWGVWFVIGLVIIELVLFLSS